MMKTKTKSELEKKIKKQKDKLVVLVILKQNFKKHHKRLPIKLKRKIKDRYNKIILYQRLLEG